MPMRKAIKSLRRNLGDDTSRPTLIVTEPRSDTGCPRARRRDRRSRERQIVSKV